MGVGGGGGGVGVRGDGGGEGGMHRTPLEISSFSP